MKKLITNIFCLIIGSNINAQTWTSNFTAGSYDVNNKYMGGNEIIHLVSHKGKLFAGNSYWMENNPQINQSSEIIMLSSPTAQWKVEKEFTTDNQRVNAMKSIVFTTDSVGNPITPDTLLIAIPTDNLGQLRVYTRDDASGNWSNVLLQQLGIQVNCRAIGNYKDPETNIHHVFIGLKGIGIVSGSYSPLRPGKIKWNTQAEYNNSLIGRFTGFSICNNKLYCSADKDTLSNYHLGQIFERTNGDNPEWKRVYVSEIGSDSENTRGLTSIQSPTGTGQELIFSWKSIIRRLQPLNNNNQVFEAYLVDSLEEKTGYSFGYVLAAYNEFTPFTIPSTGENVHLVGFQASYASSQIPRPSSYGAWSTDGKYFIRHQNGNDISYELKFIVNNTPTVTDTLVATRIMCVSPFAQDANKVLYAGGFDCNAIVSTKQAWIYRGDFNTSEVQEIKSELNISIFPNPATSELNISIPSIDNFSLELHNTLGESVLQSQNQNKIDVSALAKGIYFIKVTFNNTVYSQKIIIQ